MKTLLRMAMLVTLQLLAGCNRITVFVNSPKAVLPSVEDLQLSEDGSFQLSWSNKGASSSFKIYLKTSTLPPEQFASAETISTPQSDFLLLKKTKGHQTEVENGYALIATVDGNSFTVSDVPNPALYYSFAVVPSNLEGKNVENTHFIAKIEMGVPSDIRLSDHNADGLVNVSWNQAPGALLYAIYKDADQTEALVTSDLNQIDIEAYLERYPKLCVRSVRGKLVSPYCQTIAVSGAIALIESITAPSANGYYKSGDTVYIKLHYSAAVNVEGTPTLPLNNGAKANFASGSGSPDLLFAYQVQDGEDVDLLDVEAGKPLRLSLGTSIRAGADVNIYLPKSEEGASLQGKHLITIDTVAPTAPASPQFALNLSSDPNVSVSWGASVDQNFKNYRMKLCALNDCQSSCGTIAETTALIQVASGSDGQNYFACVQAEDKAGLRSAWLSSATTVAIDTTGPTVAKVEAVTADGYYKENENIDLKVVFSEAVTLVGSSELTMDFAGAPRRASYLSGSGSNNLLYRFAIQSGDNSSRLDLKDAAALILSAGGSIKDSAGNNAALTLPVGAHSQSLKSLSSLVIDTSAPQAPSGVNFHGAVSGTTALPFFWTAGSDTNLLQYNTKICASNDCATGCISPVDTSILNANAIGVDGGNYYACVRSEDRVQHFSSWIASAAPITIDLSLAGVLRVESPQAAGLYTTAAGIDIDIVFSKVVNVTNGADLKLQLDINATPRYAAYASGSGSNTLRFHYDIQSGDTSADLNYPNPTSLTLGATGRIRDNGTVDAILTLPNTSSGQALADLEAIVIDTTAPTAPSAIAFAGAYSTNLALPFSWSASSDVHFSHYNVKLCTSNNCSTGCIGSTTSTPTAASINGVDGTSYYACVQAQDQVNLLSAWVPSAASITVDTTVPTIASIDSPSASADYSTGANLQIQLNFSEAVTVTNEASLALALNLGGSNLATYLSGSGTSQLTFAYTVAGGDNSQDLEVASTSALSLGATGIIRDLAGLNANLTNTTSGPNSLSSRKNLIIDTTAPAAPTSVGFSAANTNSTTFNVLWSESTDLNFDTHNVKVCESNDCVSICSAVVQSATSPVAQSGVDGKTYYGCVQGRDRLGQLTAYVPSTTTILVDTTAPSVTAVTSDAALSLFKIGGTIPIKVTFSEVVNLASGTNISLLVANGGAGTTAPYTSGSGSNTLTFTYTVATGDVSTDLEMVSNAALTLAGGTTLRDVVGNNALLTLPALGGASSLSGTRTIVVDGIKPTDPTAVDVTDFVDTINPSRQITWTHSSDTNFSTHHVKLCENSNCSTSCLTAQDSSTSPKTLTGTAGKSYYACVQGEDNAGNTSDWVVSANNFTIDPSPVFGGVASVEVLGGWTGQDAKLKVTFTGVPSGHITHYKVYYSTSSSFSSFDLNAPIATIAYADATYDTSTADNYIFVARPAADVEDGYYMVRYVDQGAYFPDTNTTVVSSYVLPGTAGYKLIPKNFSGLAYDYFIMKYEASLGSGSRPGSDAVTADTTNLATCAAQFHLNGTTNHASCGTKNITRPAVSAAGVAPQAAVSWHESYFACRNASTAQAKVRMPTIEEWTRATRSFYSTYAEALTFMTTTCNHHSASPRATNLAPDCKSSMGLVDAVGNLSEWVDYRITGQSYSRFGRTLSGSKLIRNGIDNVTMQYPEWDLSGYQYTLSMGSYYNSQNNHNHGTNMLGFFRSDLTNIPGIGFRCVAFRADTMPTMAELAMAEQPKYLSADLSEAVATRRLPENRFVGDDKPERLSIVVNGNTGDAVAEGEIQLSWTPWSKTVCDVAGSCTNSEAGMTYKLYRFIDPNFYGQRLSTSPWAINITGSAYPADVVLDPIGIDSSWNPLWTSSGTHGRLLATITNCDSGTPANCAFTDNVSAGTAFSPSEIYLYVLVVGTSSGNFRYADVQRHNSAYVNGGHTVHQGSKAHSFRLEPRFRRASVFVADTAYQAAQTIPQVMVHVPMDVSGLDRDFFIQKYEAAHYSGSVNGGGGGAGGLPQVPGYCMDSIRRQNSITVADCGIVNYINYTDVVTRSKSGLTPLGTLDWGDAYRSCVNTRLTNGSGRQYRLHMPSGQEWFKAADWGDVDFDGTIDQNTFTSGVTSVSVLQDGSSPDTTTVRCHSDNSPSSAYASGNAATATCVSRYGAENMVGNVAEWTGDKIYNNVGSDTGDGYMWSSLASSTAGTASSLTYSLFSAYPMASGATVYAQTDQFLPVPGAGTYFGTHGGSYDSTHGTPGRFTLDLSHDYNTQNSRLGVRCAY